MKIYNLPISSEQVAYQIGYAHTNKKICFRVKFADLAKKDEATAQKLLAIIEKLSSSANFQADFTQQTIKLLKGMDSCYEIRLKNIRIPFVMRDNTLIILLCFLTKNKYGLDKQQTETVKRLVKQIHDIDAITLTEDKR